MRVTRGSLGPGIMAPAQSVRHALFSHSEEFGKRYSLVNVFHPNQDGGTENT